MNDIEVKVTHLINPNRFYCCDLTQQDKLEKLRQNEKNSLAIPLGETHSPHSLLNKLVYYFPPKSKKWIRCQVDEIRYTVEGDPVAVLWAIDYGKPSSTRKLDDLRLPPQDNLEVESTIFHAGLPILPAQQIKANVEKPPELVVQEEWSNEAVFYACKWIDEASAVYFRPSQTIDDEEVMFGELIIRKTNGETFEISRKLCEQGFATSSEKFLDMFNRSKSSIIERWNNNVRNGAIFEYPDSLVIGGDIGDTAEVEAAKARKIREILPKVERVKMENREAIDEINKSIDKVRLWQSNNAGVKPEDEPVNLELPLQPIPENYEYDIEAYQVLEEEKSTKEVTRKSGSSKTRSFIVVPSGAPINISVRSPRYVDENFQAVTMRPANTSQQPVESPQELYELNASPEESNDGPSDNPMEPFISKPKKADCCINQADLISVAGPDGSASEWMELKVDKEYSVNVTHFGSCNSFFLKVNDKSSKWKEMKTMLDNFKSCKQLMYPKVGTLCLMVSRHGLDRAKIIRSSNHSIVAFLVDYGKCLFFHDEVIPAFEMTPEIKNIMPFQAISCRLAGLSAPSDYQWTRCIFHKFVKNMREPKIRVVKELKSNPEKIPWGLDDVKSYEIELYEAGNEKNTIGDILFKHQIADYYV